MNKIRFSVAVCSPLCYDNAYGAKYRQLHSPEDLAVLKQCESLLSVKGGEYCGSLYWPLVCIPARGERSAKEYYAHFPSESPEAEAICAVMARNYDRYEADIWPESKAQIKAYIGPLARRFEESNFTDRAEVAIGCSLEEEAFYAVLTNSMEGGPEAIDISPSQDVFGIERSHDDAFFFIGHEFLIYLLKSALQGTDAFANTDTWLRTEGLAEFYLEQLLGERRFFRFAERQVEIYEKLTKENPNFSAKELYLAGL